MQKIMFELFDLAKEFYRENGHIPPLVGFLEPANHDFLRDEIHATLGTGDKKIFLSEIPQSYFEDKQAIAKTISNFASKCLPKAVFIITEAYLRDFDNIEESDKFLKEYRNGDLSKDPKSKSGIIIALRRFDNSKLLLHAICENGVIGEPTIQTGDDLRFNLVRPWLPDPVKAG